jgi:hypothetical protein
LKLEKDAPGITLFCWPYKVEEDDDDEEEEQNKSKNMSMKDIYPHTLPAVGEKGFKITEEGEKIFMHIEEQDKRDQDSHGMHIYTDWSGWGMTEVLENVVSSSLPPFQNLLMYQ